MILNGTEILLLKIFASTMRLTIFSRKLQPNMSVVVALSFDGLKKVYLDVFGIWGL